MKVIRFSSGREVPALGQGTWRMGENRASRSKEITALKTGIDLGMTLIDTAEMYGDGGAEEIVAEAIAGRRSDVFLVSKVYPQNASRSGLAKACERSLRRLRTDSLDLYLLHWPGPIPFSETLGGFQALKQSGKIKEFGVSNFDVTELQNAVALPGGNQIATNQVLYNLRRRGVEYDLVPWCRAHRIPLMAYSPLEQGRLDNRLSSVARKHKATLAQVAIAWLLHQDDVIVIPKSSNEARVRENYASLNVKLTEEDLRELDRLFPPPRSEKSLEML
jgi:diketogulonate reductase-like aldo/keto reductase